MMDMGHDSAALRIFIRRHRVSCVHGPQEFAAVFPDGKEQTGILAGLFKRAFYRTTGFEAARRAHASARARRDRWPATFARCRRSTAPQHRSGTRALDDSLGATGLWQDHARIAAGEVRERAVPRDLGGALGHSRSARGVGRGRCELRARRAQRAIRRRSASLQQGAAGRLSAAYREGHDPVRRRDHRESLVRTEFGAAFALPRARDGCGVGRCDCRSAATRPARCRTRTWHTEIADRRRITRADRTGRRRRRAPRFDPARNRRRRFSRRGDRRCYAHAGACRPHAPLRQGR